MPTLAGILSGITTDWGRGGVVFIGGLVSVWLQIRFKLLSRLAALISKLLSHIGAVLLQIVIVPGRKHVPQAGWQTGNIWGQPSTSSRSTRNISKRSKTRRLTALACTILLMLGLDTLGGMAIPETKTADDLRLDSAPGFTNDAQVTRIQNDGEQVRIHVNPDGTWNVGTVNSATLNTDPHTGRRTFGPSEGHKVAFIGGSAAFGLGQSDDHTIASELAKQLNTDRQQVQVTNYGMIGYTTWQAAVDLETRLAVGERFGVVVAYTGANDVGLAALGFTIPATLIDASGTRQTTGWLRGWAAKSLTAKLLGYRATRTPLRRYLVDPLDGVTATMQNAVVSRAVKNFQQGQDKLKALAKQYDFRLLIVWQPVQVDTRPKTGAWLLMNRIKAKVSEGADLYSTAGATCFYDIVHTAEMCSRALANQMRATVQQLLR